MMSKFGYRSVLVLAVLLLALVLCTPQSVLAVVGPEPGDGVGKAVLAAERIGVVSAIMPESATAPTLEPFVYDTLVAGFLAQVEEARVYSYTGNLSGEWPVTVGGTPYTITTRYTASGTPIAKATQYVYEFMEGLGLDVSYHHWSRSGYTGRNVIGELPGLTRPAEIVLITAHLDSVSNVSGHNPAPGADDNASGSVGVMTAAEILSDYDFARTLRFVLFTGEEQGLHGSYAYAQSVAFAGEEIVAVYNMDMIAWDDLGEPIVRLHTRESDSPGYSADLAIAGVFTNVVASYGLSDDLEPVIDADAIWASDHAPFWGQGYPAILAIEDDAHDFNDYYHTTQDLLAQLNMDYYTAYVRASVGTAAHLATPLHVTLKPVRVEQRAFLGRTSIYTLMLHNWDALEHGCTLSLEEGEWTVSQAPPPSVQLAAEAEEPVVIGVSVPESALPGATDTLTVTAGCESAPLLQAVLTTTALEVFYLPLVVAGW
ncbi:MAG: M28 family metallopeptidase [Anaerolineales bacterium]